MLGRGSGVGVRAGFNTEVTEEERRVRRELAAETQLLTSFVANGAPQDDKNQCLEVGKKEERSLAALGMTARWLWGLD